jgi:hypothetical protein
MHHRSGGNMWGIGWEKLLTLFVAFLSCHRKISLDA